MRKTSISLLNIFFILVLFSIFIFAFSLNVVDPDLWGHLKYGQDIFTNLSIPKHDTYSYSANGAAWINHEWLSELILFLIFRFTKGAGLVIFKYFTGLIILFLIYLSVAKYTKSIYLRLIFMALAILLISFGFAVRPQIFTYVLFTILVFLLDDFENTANARWLYSLPLIFLFWPNLHGGFVPGLGILLLYVLFKIFKKKATKNLVLITLFSLIATFINPYGAKIWAFVLDAIYKPRPYITEWERMEFTLRNLNYFVLFFLMTIGLVFSKYKRSAYEISVLLVAFYYSFQHNRHAPLFVILVLIYLPKHLDSFTGKWFLRFENMFQKNIFIPVFAILSLYFFLATAWRQNNLFVMRVSSEIFPVDSVEFIKQNNIKGNIFCSFNWSQMCIRELYPMNKVFFDGRYETVYSDELIKEYFDTAFSRINYKVFLNKFPQTDIMFLKKTLPLVKDISKDKDWVLVYSSGIALVYLNANNRNNRIYIDNFKANRLKYPKTILKEYNLDAF